MKIMSIVGARPQFIKIALLSQELRRSHTELVVHTGQHYDFELSDIFFKELNIPKADINLDVGSGTHGEQTGNMLAGIEKALMEQQPDLVIVFGDTNSTLAGALAASKLGIKIAHVESGMRNYDRQKPEEINRIVTDHVSDILFAATQTAVDNLASEGLKKRVYLTGDISYDVLLRNQVVAEDRSDVLKRFEVTSGEYFTVTIHKTKNTDNRERLEKIVRALARIDSPVIFPIHPRTKNFIEQYGLHDSLKDSNVRLSQPLGYLDFIKLVKHSRKLITDSGGAQKEAYALRVPCITLRETEWVETVKEGWNRLVEVEEEAILEAVQNFEPPQRQRNFLGDGDAYVKIANTINEL